MEEYALSLLRKRLDFGVPHCHLVSVEHRNNIPNNIYMIWDPRFPSLNLWYIVVGLMLKIWNLAMIKWFLAVGCNKAFDYRFHSVISFKKVLTSVCAATYSLKYVRIQKTKFRMQTIILLFSTETSISGLASLPLWSSPSLLLRRLGLFLSRSLRQNK